MKINLDNLLFPTSKAFEITVDTPKQKWDSLGRKDAAKAMLKARGLNKELSWERYKEILLHNGWELVEEPREALWRKKEIRSFEVFEENESLGIIKAETKEEACALASQNKYGTTDTYVDQKGREKLVWELNLCDISAKEIEG